MATNYTNLSNQVKVFTPIDGVDDDTTSSSIKINGAKKVAIVFTQDNTNSSEEADLTIDVSIDDSTFVDYNMLIENSSDTNSENLTRVSSKTLNGDESTILFMEPKTLGAITHIKADVDVTNSDQATFTVKVAVCY